MMKSRWTDWLIAVVVTLTLGTVAAGESSVPGNTQVAQR